jgi:hypothetical protein
MSVVARPGHEVPVKIYVPLTLPERQELVARARLHRRRPADEAAYILGLMLAPLPTEVLKRLGGENALAR